MVRAARADPADAGIAGKLDRGLGGARHHQMAHAVVAVDQRGRCRGLLDADVGLRIDAAAAHPVDVLPQPEHAVGVGAGEVGLEHQLGDLGGVARAGRPIALNKSAISAAMVCAGTRDDVLT